MQNHLIIMALSFLTIAISTQGNSGCLAGENKVVEDLWICDDWADEKPQTAEEQYQEMLNDSKYSEEDLQEFYDKMFAPPTVTRADITFEVLAVPYYRQEEEYYGGPATARQTVAFLTGNVESQKDIFEKVKADGEDSKATLGDRLKNYVNSMQSVNVYALKYPSSASEMSEDIYADLSRGVPVILWVKVTQEGNWIYNTKGGHFMNATGINTGGSLIQVTDPYIMWVEDSPYINGKYWVTTEEAYSATKARGLGYFK